MSVVFTNKVTLRQSQRSLAIFMLALVLVASLLGGMFAGKASADGIEGLKIWSLRVKTYYDSNTPVDGSYLEIEHRLKYGGTWLPWVDDGEHPIDCDTVWSVAVDVYDTLLCSAIEWHIELVSPNTGNECENWELVRTDYNYNYIVTSDTSTYEYVEYTLFW